MATAMRLQQIAAPEKDVRDVELRLTIAEAEVLHAIMRLIGGCLHKSPRKHTDSIRCALEHVNVTPLRGPISGDIYCDDYPSK